MSTGGFSGGSYSSALPPFAFASPAAGWPAAAWPALPLSKNPRIALFLPMVVLPPKDYRALPLHERFWNRPCVLFCCQGLMDFQIPALPDQMPKLNRIILEVGERGQ